MNPISKAQVKQSDTFTRGIKRDRNDIERGRKDMGKTLTIAALTLVRLTQKVVVFQISK